MEQVILTTIECSKDELKLVNLEINAMTTRFTNLSEEKEKLINISNGEYETIIDLIEKELINLHFKKSFKVGTKEELNHQILENENDLITYEKLLEYLGETFNISSGNIIGLHCANLRKISTLDKELIKGYTEFYNIKDEFNIHCYLTEVDLYAKIDKDIIRKAIINWMDFQNLSNSPMKQGYILNVINSSAGIKGWANQ